LPPREGREYLLALTFGFGQVPASRSLLQGPSPVEELEGLYLLCPYNPVVGTSPDPVEELEGL